MLPQLVFLAVTFAAIGFGSRWVKQEIDRVDDQMARLRDVLARAHRDRTPRLVYDPATRTYLPAKEKTGLLRWRRKPLLTS